MRPRLALALTLALACTPNEPALTDATTGPDASTSAGVLTDGASSTGAPTSSDTTALDPTTDTGDTGNATTDSTGTTGEPVDPGCDDGVAVAGELCFVHTELEVFSWLPEELVLTDLDGDGHLDLVGPAVLPCPLLDHDDLRGARGPLGLADALDPSRDGASNVQIESALGDGLGGFVAGPPLDPGGGSARGLVAAEVTGDGVIDVLLLIDDSSLHVFAGVGDGTLAPPIVHALPETWLNDLVAGDFDGDGATDLVAVGASVVLLRGDGTGQFTAETFATDGGLPRREVLAHDLDDDGDLDLIVARWDMKEDAVAVLHNDGVGALASVQQLAVPDGAGEIDLLPGAPGGRPRLLINDGQVLQHARIAADGTLEPPQTITLDNYVSGVMTGRFDGDDRHDAILLDGDGLHALLDADAWPQPALPLAELPLWAWPLGHAVGDVNADGVDDIFIAYQPHALLLSRP